MIRASMTLPMTARGDWRAYLRESAENGANTIRFFLNYLDDDCGYPNALGPFVAVGTWNPGKIAGEPAYDHDVPIYDLAQLNPDFLARLREIAAEMKSLNLMPWVAFDDRCSEIEGDWRQFLDPYYGSIQLHPWWNANPPSTERAYAGGNKALELNQYRASLERQVVAIFRDAGHSAIYAEPVNEYGYEEGPAYSINDMITWFRQRCQHLRDIGCTVVASTRPPITAAMVEPYIDLYDQHAIIEVDDIAAHPNGLPAAQVIWNTDGAWNGTGAGVSVFGIRDASPNQMFTLGEEIVRQGAAGGCFLSQKQIDSAEMPWNMDAIDHAPVLSLALGTGWTEPEPPPVEYVTVTVCTLTQDVANKYCPTTVTEKFVKGTEPTDVCVMHVAPDPEDDMWDKIMDWLFGDNSWWELYPWRCVAGLLLVGFVIGAIVF